MLTALGSEVDKIVGLELGADDYITKPFSPVNWLPELGQCFEGLLKMKTIST